MHLWLIHIYSVTCRLNIAVFPLPLATPERLVSVDGGLEAGS